MAVPEKYRTGWRLLGRDDAPLMPHRQAAVQSLQDFHSRSGIAGTFPPWQQLQGMQLESHRVVPGNFSAVLEAQGSVPDTAPGPGAGMQAQGIAVEHGNAG